MYIEQSYDPLKTEHFEHFKKLAMSIYVKLPPRKWLRASSIARTDMVGYYNHTPNMYAAIGYLIGIGLVEMDYVGIYHPNIAIRRIDDSKMREREGPISPNPDKGESNEQHRI